MTTVINSPGNNGEGMGMGMIIGVLIAIVAIILFFVYGLPAIRNSNTEESSNTTINVEVPPIIPTSNSSSSNTQ